MGGKCRENSKFEHNRLIGLHVARHKVFSGPQKHSEKKLKFEIC